MKKYITFIIIALLFTLTTSIMLPALKVNAEIENSGSVNSTGCGVAPAIKIKLS